MKLMGSLWRAIQRVLHHQLTKTPIRHENRAWAKTDIEKANVLGKTFVNYILT